MSKIAVVYWSGTGNTKAMAEIVTEGAKEVGAAAVLLTAAVFTPNMVKDYDGIAFGCPSMGVEQLEDTEFEPMFQSCESELKGKKIALFGSYGWGDGEWMRNWEEMCISDRVILVCDSVICNEAPDSETENACKVLGVALANA